MIGRLKKLLIFGLILLLIIICILSVYVHINEQYKPQTNDPVLLAIIDKIKQIHPKVEQLEFYDSDKSYTINKQKVHLCLKDKDGYYYNENMLTYVALHELAHVLCDEVGHTEKFYQIFDQLLDKAHDMGLYDPSIPIIKDYCNH
jgi:hypothetical protein